MEEERKTEVSGPVERNIRSIVAMERKREEKKSDIDHIGHAIADFIGSKLSIALHAIWFATWMLVNTGHIHGARVFDPYPFSLLSVCVSCEAVLLSSIVLVKQNHMQHRADHLDQLNLQIDLLTEKEVTKSLQLLRAICVKLEVMAPLGDAELSEMSQVTSVGTLAERILEDLPPRV